MTPENQQSQQPAQAAPQHVVYKTMDTHSYRGWLNSDSFLKRAFAIYGYNFVASLLISIPLIIVFSIVIGFVATSFATAFKDEMAREQASNMNITQVCENAVAYMTFPDANATEVFLEECEEGKHPEVLEQYEAQMNPDYDARDTETQL